MDKKPWKTGSITLIRLQLYTIQTKAEIKNVIFISENQIIGPSLWCDRYMTDRDRSVEPF